MQKQTTVSGLRKEVLYPELSYDVMGVLFKVFAELGSGHKEHYYENAVAIGLQEKKIPFERQLYVPLKFQNKTVGKYYLDFLIDKKIVLELKAGTLYSTKKQLEQVLAYLKAHDLKLGILALFGATGVKYKRILNLY